MNGAGTPQIGIDNLAKLRIDVDPKDSKRSFVLLVENDRVVATDNTDSD